LIIGLIFNNIPKNLLFYLLKIIVHIFFFSNSSNS
jgi:hypothetical protein